LTFQNVTVSNNQSARGKGIFCSNGSEIILRNSIFSENTDAIHFLDYNAENYITSYWSDVHGPIVTNSNGSFIWEEGSINEDPLFESTGDHPYALSLGSPCIDAGNPDTTGLNLPQWDVMGNQRIWDGDGNGTEIIDMGAYEFGAVPIGVEQLAVGSWQLAMKVFPNPASGIVNCQFGIVKYQRVIIKIYDLNGREVATVMDKMMPAGEHTVSFDAASLSAGVYVYKKTEVSSQKSEVGKLIKY
jgi:hypothetical protein